VSRSVFALSGLLMVGAWTSGPVTASSSTAPARRAETSLQASVTQGFNFQKDSRDIIGHINYLKIGDTEMDSDLNVTDPENIANYVKVFGVASNIHWKGGYADPVQFSAQVSVPNKNRLATLQHKSMANTEVELRFTFYDWDPKQKKYYQAFHTNAVKVKGLVLKSGGSLAMNIDMNQSMEVVSPKNHTFTVGVMPADAAQQLYLAVSVSDKFTKAWGVAVAK
jgi:hypothetical protein